MRAAGSVARTLSDSPGPTSRMARRVRITGSGQSSPRASSVLVTGDSGRDFPIGDLPPDEGWSVGDQAWQGRLSTWIASILARRSGAQSTSFRGSWPGFSEPPQLALELGDPSLQPANSFRHLLGREFLRDVLPAI